MALMHLMLGLPSRGVKPVLLSTPPAKPYRLLYSRLKAKGVELALSRRGFKGFLYWIWLFFAVIKAIKRFRISIVHCHGTKEAFFAGLAAKLLRRRVVYTVEGDPLLEISLSPERYSLLDRFSLKVFWFLGLRLADVIVGCSRWMAEHVKRYRVRAFFIHNAIDYERFSSISKRMKNEDTAIVISVARFERAKGLDILIKAARKVIKEAPNVKFILVGGGSLKDKLQKLARRLKIEPYFLFLEYTPQVDELLSKATVAVLPSIYEPFGMAAAEALAAGKPVIVARTGGLQEIVVDGMNGFLFAPGNPEDLAKKILQILKDKKLRKRMAEEARKTAKRFSPERISRSYVRIYRAILLADRDQQYPRKSREF